VTAAEVVAERETAPSATKAIVAEARAETTVSPSSATETSDKRASEAAESYARRPESHVSYQAALALWVLHTTADDASSELFEEHSLGPIDATNPFILELLNAELLRANDQDLELTSVGLLYAERLPADFETRAPEAALHALYAPPPFNPRADAIVNAFTAGLLPGDSRGMKTIEKGTGQFQRTGQEVRIERFSATEFEFVVPGSTFRLARDRVARLIRDLQHSAWAADLRF